MEIDMLKYEKELYEKGYLSICGIDEAGRGPLAGPVCAAAVIFEKGEEIEGVNDSKKLTEKKRELLYDKIIEKAKAYSIAFGTVEEIEEINILNATMLAMQRAVKGLKIKPEYVLIDGNKLPEIGINSQAIVKGDSKSMTIAAASILAKVTRDRLLKEYDKKYPQYEFKRHKGYGTKLHMEKIREYGICEIHRKSFLKKVLEE